MPIYVYACPKCGFQREVLHLNPMDAFNGEVCGTEGCTLTLGSGRVIPTIMERVPTAASFSVGGYNAKNGYSK